MHEQILGSSAGEMLGAFHWQMTYVNKQQSALLLRAKVF